MSGLNIKSHCLIYAVILGLASCQKESYDNYKYRSEGTITSLDYRMCPTPCCGGWFIIIDKQTYEFNSLPDGSGIDLNKEKLPLAVRLDWQSKQSNCANNWITIQRIRRK